MIALWVALGAAVGAPLRYFTHRVLAERTPSRVAWGTLAANLVASFLLGVVSGASGMSAEVVALLGTGFCGALSTWSTLAHELVDLVGLRERAVAAGYLAISLAGGFGLAAFGWSLSP